MQAVDAKELYPEESSAAALACLMNICLCCVGAALNRKALREKLNREGSFLVDCLLEFFCCCCAVNQEWREVFSSKYQDENTPIWKALGKKEHNQA
jgi:Cys-rich protein (TIGR01571 family)